MIAHSCRGDSLAAIRVGTMRKNSVFFLGALAGACLTVLVTGPRGEALIAAARAAASPDTYSQLNLFGDVFERIRVNYVEKPDDGRLIEASISGMLGSLDPHSRYMNEKAWRDMQETPAANSADSAWRSPWRTAWSR